MSSAISVVISCAGIGSRLGLGTTKALIPIEGKTLIQWQLEMFEDIEDIRIVVGFQAQEVINEVRKHRDDAIFIYNHDYFHTKTGTSLYLGAQHAKEYVLGYDGDLLVHPEDMEQLLKGGGVEYIAYSDVSSDEAILITTNEQGDVLSFSPSSGSFEWTGPACIKKEKLQYTSQHVYNQLEKYLPIRGVKIRACDIDTYKDYKRAIEFVKSWS